MRTCDSGHARTQQEQQRVKQSERNHRQQRCHQPSEHPVELGDIDANRACRPCVADTNHHYLGYNINTHTRASNGDYVVPRTRLKFGERPFSVAAPPPPWNRLPTELKLMGSTPVFKRSLKTFLFQTAYCSKLQDRTIILESVMRHRSSCRRCTKSTVDCWSIAANLERTEVTGRHLG